MRSVKYQKRGRRAGWVNDLDRYLQSKGLTVLETKAKDVKKDKHYMKVCFSSLGDRKSAHATVSRGLETVHDPAKFLRKKLKERKDNRIVYATHYFEIRKRGAQ